MLIDCHAHLDAFSDAEVSPILERARLAGVAIVVTACTTLESSLRSARLSSRFEALFSGVGIHPMDLDGPVDDSTCERLAQTANSTSKVLVISEIGLDFMEGMPDRAIQYQAFRQQIRLARELRLPVVFHSREADDETLRVLREEQAYQVGGIMHYFQGDMDTARRAMDLGFYISLARPLLRLPNLQAVAAPQPFKSKRGNWTEPRHVREVAGKLAELQDRSVEEVEAATSESFLSLIESRRWVIERSLGTAVDVSGAGQGLTQNGLVDENETHEPSQDSRERGP